MYSLIVKSYGHATGFSTLWKFQTKQIFLSIDIEFSRIVGSEYEILLRCFIMSRQLSKIPITP